MPFGAGCHGTTLQEFRTWHVPAHDEEPENCTLLKRNHQWDHSGVEFNKPIPGIFE